MSRWRFLAFLLLALAGAPAHADDALEPAVREIERLALSSHWQESDARIRVLDAKRDALREDASYLVQTSAIDSLSAFPGDDTLAAAMRLSASRHPLVRGYAYICVGTAGRLLGDEERAGLRNRLSAIRETDTLRKSACLKA